MASVGEMRVVWQMLRWNLLWTWRWAQRQLGWAAVVGVVTLTGGLVLGAWSRTLDAQSRILESRITSLERTVQRVRKPDSSQRLRAFYAALPSADRIPPAIAKLIELANVEHVALHSAEYRPSVEAAGRYMSYKISLPVTGDAKAIQSFLIASLGKQRTLALQSIAFKRERSESRAIDAQIRFALITGLPRDNAAEPAQRLSASNANPVVP